MKKNLTTALSLTLAVIMAFLGAAQVFADSQKAYVGEVKVALGDSAESDLTAEGFAILCDEDGDPIDLNQGAGGGKYSQGDKKVLLGYKTTTDIKKAITDLAVMNMCGGYKVEEYDLLMKRYLGAQISPFIDRFLVTINEYRENMESEDEANRARAEYVRAALNKYTDDDCGGAGLGDLLLNETVYEMAKPQFDSLSEEEQEKQGIAAVNAQVRDAMPAAERNQHCDILTLFAQADGQVMLTVYALLTRAADTSDDSWIDRFAAMSYDDLLDSYDMAPTDARKKAARDFDDDAHTILTNWETFRAMLIGTDEDAVSIDSIEMPDIEDTGEKIDALTDHSTEEEILEAYEDAAEAQARQSELLDLAGNITVADYLETFEYGDGTLYDFFTRSVSDVTADIESLYPLVAALSEGQRSGLEFLSLREFVMLSNREAAYSVDDLEDIAAVSVFEGIDRAIYKTGGVALTSDTLRTQALKKQKNLADRNMLSTKSIVLWAITGACAVAFIGSVIGFGVRSKRLITAARELESTQSMQTYVNGLIAKKQDIFKTDKISSSLSNNINKESATVQNLTASTNTAYWMSVGFAAATFLMTAVSAYMTWQDLKDYYKVDYAVIPHYMVDEASITYINERGEKLVKENHAAYYEAVTCFRKEGDKNYQALTDCADLNGDVGQQWLALYACRDYKEMQPILADSFRVVVGSSEIPAGYDNRGIHMFGSDSAFNLNSKLYDWNQSARSVFVYFKVDETAPLGDASTSGSAFSAGIVAVFGVCGVGLGALVTALAMTAVNKRKAKRAVSC